MRGVRKLGTVAAVTVGVLAGGLLVSVAPAVAAPETPETVSPAKLVTATTATLEGVLDPHAVSKGEPGSYQFDYAPSETDACTGGSVAPASPVFATGEKAEKVSVGLTKLEPNKEYDFCVVAYGLSGFAEPFAGAAVPFKTLPAPPTAATEPATGVKAEEAHLEGLVNPNNESTKCEFEYGTDPSLTTSTPVPCEPETLAGYGAQGVGLTVPGLTAATSYYYRVVAENEEGKTETGAIEHFKTAVHVLAPETEAATAVTGTTATLNGTLKPPATKLKYEFEYNTGTSCEGGATSTESEGEGKVATPVTGLEGSSEYAFCVVEINEGSETAVGAPLTFETPANAPVVGVESSSEVTPFAAKLQAEVNPENQPTASCVFEYGETVSEHKTPCEQGTVEGASPQTTTLSVAGLKSATTYHYRVVVKNATGDTDGAEEEFMTLTAQAPSIASESIGGLSATGATFGAHINPSYQTTTYAFEYATNSGLMGATRAEGVRPLAAESAELPVSVAVSGLTPGTTYYYRVAATNATGTTTDPTIESFTTPVLALVSTGQAQNITQTTATLSGTINPEGVETTYYFQYVTQAAYRAALAEGAPNPYQAGETTSPVKLTEEGEAPYTGDEPQTVGPIPATGLLPDTTYHYRLLAQNESHNGAEGSIETSYGTDATFTTAPPTPPIVSTGGASAISQNAATLSGTVDTNSLQTAYGFEIATEPGNYGPATGLGSIGGATTEAVDVTLGELQPDTTYYYRVTATNADGTVAGQPESFTTTGFPTLLTTTASLPLIAAPNIAFPKEEPATPTRTTTKPLTKAQKLEKALKVCKQKKGAKRAKCEAAARKKYGVAKKAKGK